MRYCILLLALPFCMAFGRIPTLSYVDLKEEALILIPPDTDRFMQLVAASIAPDSLAAMQPVMPYCVLLYNGSRSNLLGATIIYELVNTQGKPIAHRFTLQMRNYDARQLLRPGDVALFCPVGTLNRKLSFGSEKMRLHGTLSWSSQQLFEQQKSIRISLDSAVFEDGVIVGPDTSGNLVNINAYGKAEQDVEESIVKASVDSLRSTLTYISSSAPGDDAYRRHMKRVADHYLAQLDAAGEASVIASAKKSLAATKPAAVHRKTQ